ncbi:AMP-binding protein [Halomonas sp. CKK8]|uniref:class I adenylate-forming enzyme family protein n=1 Tax=Halomonas sp. CKK8 TaxID=3036127 RepID=UPI002415772F|nr:AMP-binding protein [Halomonas sp. CKK8]WFM73299.1 AMP-binding protein [Halomonas sp. CKK8]
MANYLEVNSGKFPERTAVQVGFSVIHTYASLDEKARRLGAFLQKKKGLEAGDRIALLLPNSYEYIELLCGIWYAGMVAVPINHKLTVSEVQYILSDSGARVVFTNQTDVADLLEDVETLSSAVPHWELQDALERHCYRDSRDPAWIFYTSGTTGKPKGATLTHLNLASMASGYLIGIEPVSESHKLIHFAPMSHGSGLYLVPFLMAGGANLIPDPVKFTPENFVATVNAYERISMFLAPTMVRRVLDYLAANNQPLTVENIATITYGGGPMYAKDLNEALDVFGYRLVQIYGQGESPMTITYLSREQHRALKEKITKIDEESTPLLPVGHPHPQLEVAIRGEQSSFLPTGQDGEVCVRGDTVMQGYWGKEEASRNALADGWLHTGDVGHLDENGFLYLTDRLKDVIISGGTNIYPREVEEILLKFTGVREVSVVGRRDADWGEVVVAFVVASREVSEGDLDRFCLENMARFKRPKEYVFMDDLPKNAYGKILKTELRKLL